MFSLLNLAEHPQNKSLGVLEVKMGIFVGIQILFSALELFMRENQIN